MDWIRCCRWGLQPRRCSIRSRRSEGGRAGYRTRSRRIPVADRRCTAAAAVMIHCRTVGCTEAADLGTCSGVSMGRPRTAVVDAADWDAAYRRERGGERGGGDEGTRGCGLTDSPTSTQRGLERGVCCRVLLLLLLRAAGLDPPSSRGLYAMYFFKLPRLVGWEKEV